MEQLFLQVLNLSIVASFVICVVFIIRLLLRKAPKIYSCILWYIALFKLLYPFTIQSIFSIVPINQQAIPKDIGYAAIPQINTGVMSIDRTMSSLLPPGTMYASVNPMQIWIYILSVVWMIGVVTILTIGVINLFDLRKKLSEAIHIKDNIYRVVNLPTALVFGIVCPQIYLPDCLSDTETSYILQHEQTHIKRYDHLTRIIAYLALAIHWFNPLVWLMFILFAQDMEMSCDEAVIKTMGAEVKKEYSTTLLNLTVKISDAYGPLTFAKGDTKARINNILKYKRPAIQLSIFALLLVSMSIVGLVTSQVPKTVKEVSTQVIPNVALESGKLVTEISDSIIQNPEKLNLLKPIDEESSKIVASLDAYPGHTGVDFSAPLGTNIIAAASGTVIVAEKEVVWPYGKYIDIDHGNGWLTRYAHCNEVLVKVGETVKPGDIIAKVGKTGNATGSQLHFELRKNEDIHDPEEYFDTI